MSVYVVLCVFAAILPNLCSSAEVQNGSSLVDYIIETAKVQKGDQLDPMVIPNKGYQKRVNLGLFKAPVEVLLFNMSLSGLTTLKRKGDAYVQTLVDGSTEINATLSAGVLDFMAKGTARALRLGPTYDYSGRIGYIEISLLVILPGDAEKPYVRKLKITKFNGFKVKVDGPGVILDFLTNTALRAMVKVFRPLITYSTEAVLQVKVNQALKKKNLFKNE